MTFSETYQFDWKKYDKEGTNAETGIFFLDTIKEWEHDFIRKHPLYYPNYLFGNHRTMSILESCYQLEAPERFGMELINGRIDFDANMEMEKYSEYRTCYGISSGICGRMDEPVYLVIDDSLSNGIVRLKYIPDDDDYDDVEMNAPVDVFQISK